MRGPGFIDGLFSILKEGLLKLTLEKRRMFTAAFTNTSVPGKLSKPISA